MQKYKHFDSLFSFILFHKENRLFLKKPSAGIKNEVKKRYSYTIMNGFSKIEGCMMLLCKRKLTLHVLQRKFVHKWLIMQISGMVGA